MLCLLGFSFKIVSPSLLCTYSDSTSEKNQKLFPQRLHNKGLCETANSVNFSDFEIVEIVYSTRGPRLFRAYEFHVQMMYKAKFLRLLSS